MEVSRNQCSDTGGSIDIAPGGEYLLCSLELRVFIDLIQHRTLSSGDGPLSMLIGCGLFVEITPVAYVDPFEMPSRSIRQLRGNRTLVGRVVRKFLVLLAGLKSFPCVIVDVYS
ncbi:hypothetical protein F2Q68_00025292 [Brassica cretica]|uniref:Uncharacterized protein n=1 Tax=Brassica cretica TaxID=69181 RepID=A0A8S9IEY8_BRACR|nr:hypothetical protein F2Q68_00025292 [Brassica cretica]